MSRPSPARPVAGLPARWKGLLAGRPRLLLILVLTVAALPAAAQTEVKLLPEDGMPNAEFGRDVALSGDIALVGAPLDPKNGFFSGSAYVFRRNGEAWTEEAKLTANDGVADDYLGSSVALVGDVALVGSPLDDDLGPESGGVYVFEYDGSAWAQSTKLLASDGAPGDIFGTSIAFDGEVAVIGASFSDDLGTGSGSAYVFRYDGSTWTEEAKLLASDGAAFDFFGNSVAVEGDLVLVGAQITDNSGRVYVFQREGSSWTEQQRLLPNSSFPDLSFGFSIALDADIALIGAIGDTVNGSASGSAFVFRRNEDSLEQQQKLTPADGASAELFGYDVALGEGVALVGARNDGDDGSRSGSVYLYEREGTTWVERSELSPSDGGAGDGFGGSIAVSSGDVLVGALFDDDNGTFSGSAYVFPTLLATPTESAPPTSGFVLLGLFPNPATDQVRVTYAIDAAAPVRVELYDVLGRRVKSTQVRATAGAHTIRLATASLPVGVYLLRVEAGRTVTTRLLTVMR